MLFTPLIYITPRTDQDFITPLNKMFAQYKKLIVDAENGNIVKKDKYLDDILTIDET